MDVFDTDKYDSVNLESVWNVMNSAAIKISNSVSSPQSRNPTTNLNFTGNKDTDFLIIQNLPDEDLKNFCQLNSYARKLCEDDNFWRKRTLTRFKEMGEETLVKYKEINTKKWKEYYIRLANELENIYNGWGDRRRYDDTNTDLKLLRELVFKNSNILFENDISEEITNMDLINPNFYVETKHFLFKDLPTMIKELKIIVKDPRFRVEHAIEEVLSKNFDHNTSNFNNIIIAALDVMTDHYNSEQLLDAFFNVVQIGLRMTPPVIKYVIASANKKGATKKQISKMTDDIEIEDEEEDLDRAKDQKYLVREIRKIIRHIF